MAVSDNIKRGSIELLILTLLASQNMYGYELVQEIKNQSHQLYTMQESSLSPSLYRLMDKGLISDQQIKVSKRRVRVYYHPEVEGRRYLAEIRKEYLTLCRDILYLLNIDSLEEMVDEEQDELQHENPICNPRVPFCK